MCFSKDESSPTQENRIMYLCQQRYVVALLGFLFAVCTTSHRVNISIAIVAMVNSTKMEDNWTTMNGSTECPAGLHNSTDSSSALFPSALAFLMAHWFPKSERGFLSALLVSGMPTGAFITGLTGGIICEIYGWPFIFYVFGLFGVFVTILCLVFFFDKPENDPRISKEELKHIQDLQLGDMPVYNTQTPTPWFKMFTSLPTISLIVAIFGTQWMNYYLVSVHALYLGTVLHLPIRQNGFLTGGPFAVAIVVLLLASFLSFWINRHTKLKIETIRKGFNSASCIGFSVGLMGVYFSGCDILLNKIFLYFTTGISTLNYVGAFVTPNDMSPTYCGILLGFSNTVGSLAGFIVPLMAGKLTNEGQNLTQWRKIFLISASISLGCGLIFQFLGSAEIQPWDPAFSINKKKTSERKTKDSEQLVVSSDL